MSIHAYSGHLIGENIVLRLPQATDAPQLASIANDWEVAKGTLNLPYPYTLTDAEDFLDHLQARQPDDPQQTFAIARRSDNLLIGMCGIGTEARHERAEIGYWIGKAYWGNGYATQAARCLIAYGFSEQGLNRIDAQYFTDNPASRRVMEKAGMTYEGTLRQALIRENDHLNYRAHKDIGICAILRDEWQA